MPRWIKIKLKIRCDIYLNNRVIKLRNPRVVFFWQFNFVLHVKQTKKREVAIARQRNQPIDERMSKRSYLIQPDSPANCRLTFFWRVLRTIFSAFVCARAIAPFSAEKVVKVSTVGDFIPFHISILKFIKKNVNKLICNRLYADSCTEHMCTIECEIVREVFRTSQIYDAQVTVSFQSPYV